MEWIKNIVKKEKYLQVTFFFVIFEQFGTISTI